MAIAGYDHSTLVTQRRLWLQKKTPIKWRHCEGNCENLELVRTRLGSVIHLLFPSLRVRGYRRPFAFSVHGPCSSHGPNSVTHHSSKLRICFYKRSDWFFFTQTRQELFDERPWLHPAAETSSGKCHAWLSALRGGADSSRTMMRLRRRRTPLALAYLVLPTLRQDRTTPGVKHNSLRTQRPARTGCLVAAAGRLCTQPAMLHLHQGF